MSDRDYERSLHDELDPDLSEAAEAERLREKRRAGALAMQAAQDLENLISKPEFIRWFFTVLDKAGMHRAAFLPHEGATQYAAGRRGLGVELYSDILRINPQFPIALAVEQAKVEEALRDRPSPTRR